MTVKPLHPMTAVCREDRMTTTYRQGVAKLKAWHEDCRRKKLGIGRDMKEKLRSKIRWQKEKGKVK